MDAETVTDLVARLEAIDRKLDYVVERQRYLEELVDEMTPVVREALRVGGETLSDLERRGYFAFGREAWTLLESLVASYGADEVRALAALVDHPERLTPVGPLGVARATREPEVQQGLALAIELLRHLGRSHPGAPSTPRPPEAPTPSRRPTPTPAAPARAAPAPAPAARPPAPVAGEVVEWEGARFDPDGFLVDPAAWTEALAGKMAAALELPLTDDHWVVIRWARADFLATGASPNVRRVASGSGIGTRRMYELFPQTPGKTAAMLAGIPKPVGCV